MLGELCTTDSTSPSGGLVVYILGRMRITLFPHSKWSPMNASTIIVEVFQHEAIINNKFIVDYCFMLELRRELGDRFEHFQSLDSFVKLPYVLGSEAREEYSSGWLSLIKDFVGRKGRAKILTYTSLDLRMTLRGVAGGEVRVFVW